MSGVLGRSIEEFLSLEPQEVAMLILADLQHEPEGSNTALGAWNYNLRIQQLARSAGAPEHEVIRAGGIAFEGWEWLRAHGHKFPTPSTAASGNDLRGLGERPIHSST